jgi:hypothetical protein
MTKEEYIEFATALKNNYTIDFDKLPEFCNMAISALSENKGDKISRQAVLELLQMKYFGKDLYKAIYELPSVENKGERRENYISIDDVMSVFDDFMCGEVDEGGTETFLEMLKDKIESEEV